MQSRTTVSEENVLLIYPPYFRLMGEYRIWYPLGLGYLSSCLRAHGFSPVVYNADAETKSDEHVLSYHEKFYESKKVIMSAADDNHFIWQELRDVLNRVKPKIIGISILTETMPVINKIASLCKEYSESVPVVLGGPHLMVDYKSLSQVENWDYALLGETEGSLPRLVKCVLSNRPPSKSIEGLMYRHAKNVIENETFAVYRGRLDKLPFPVLGDMIDFKTKCEGKMKKTMISTSRGCPFRCTFCYMNNYRRKMKFRTAANVIEEIKFNLNKYGITKFYFNDDSFGVNKKFLKEFSRIISKEKLEIRWSCMTHERIVNTESLKLMKEAGCDSIHIGVESGSDKILRLLGKKTTVNRIVQKCKLIKGFGIKIKAFFMAGIPSECEEDLKESIDLLQKIDPYEAILQIYVPYPNTELWKYIEQNYGNPSKFYEWISFYKSKINYRMFPKIPPTRFDDLLREFFSAVERINKKNHVY